MSKRTLSPRMNYEDLMQFIQHEKTCERDIILKGAREIALRISKNEHRFKPVYSMREIPIYRENGQLRLSNWAYEQYLALKEDAAALGVPYKALVLQRQPFDPKKRAADLAESARTLRERKRRDEPFDYQRPNAPSG